MSSMYPRSEFPVETPPALRNARGAVSLSAIAWRFSAMGCPNAKPAVAAALMKAGTSDGTALQLAMLAHYIGDLSIDCIERTTRAIQHGAENEHARQYPHGKYAEARAARIEGRPSRWGTAEMHGAVTPNTPHFPYREPQR